MTKGSEVTMTQDIIQMGKNRIGTHAVHNLPEETLGCLVVCNYGISRRRIATAGEPATIGSPQPEMIIQYGLE